MNIRLKLAALFALTALGTARAADMPVKAPPPAPSTPLYNWNGFYVGANAGGAWGNFDPTTSAPFGTIFFNVGGGAGAAANVTAVGRQSISASGFIGGLESGYNFQFGPAVFGVEGDIESMQLSGTKQSTGLYPLGSPVFAISSSASANGWLPYEAAWAWPQTIGCFLQPVALLSPH